MTDSQSFGKRRRSDEGRKARREDLLRAARELFEERGYEKTTVAAIVERAGVAQGTFYLYFEGKQKVLVHLRARVLDDLVRAFADADDENAAADERLVAGVGALARITKRDRTLLRVIRQATSGEETELVWIKGRETLAAPLGRLIRDGVSDGRFEVDDPDLAAYLALVLFDDLLYEAVVFKKPAGPRRTQRVGLRFLLRGLGVKAARIEALVP